MKPIDISVHLEYNGRQINDSVNNLKRIRKKLQYSELVLNDEPPKDEKCAVVRRFYLLLFLIYHIR